MKLGALVLNSKMRTILHKKSVWSSEFKKKIEEVPNFKFRSIKLKIGQLMHLH